MSYIPNKNKISTANSTNTPLNAGEGWTGTTEDVSNYSSLIVAGDTDQEGSISVQFSVDGTNWDSAIPFKFRSTSSYGVIHRFTIARQYFRVIITNTSAVNQTFLRFESILGDKPGLNSAGNSTLQLEADTIAVRTLDPNIEVARGLREGIISYHKFGRNSSPAAGETIWSTSTNYAEPVSAATVNVTSASANDTGNGTGARTLFIEGTNENLVLVSETLQLSGLSNSVTTNKYYVINRCWVTSAGSSGTAAGAITLTSTAAGTPVMGTIVLGTNMMESSVFQVPAGYSAYISNLRVTGNATATTSLGGLVFQRKDFGGVFRVAETFITNINATSQVIPYKIPLKLDEKTIIRVQIVTMTTLVDTVASYDIELIKN